MVKMTPEDEERLNALVQEAVALAGGDMAKGFNLFLLKLANDPARAGDLALMERFAAENVFPMDKQ